MAVTLPKYVVEQGRDPKELGLSSHAVHVNNVAQYPKSSAVFACSCFFLFSAMEFPKSFIGGFLATGASERKSHSRIVSAM